MKLSVYYVLLFAGVVLLIALPFLALQQTWSLLITIPLALAWGTWAVMSYWRWVRSLGK